MTTDEERTGVDRGKAARKAAPRSAHAAFEPAAGRPDPVDVLERQAATRVPDLVPIRYGRMLVSPFTFYRGTAAIMAADLAGTPDSGITVQCCGDAHLSNFGVFASQDRRLVFDLNDFDETLPGPWEWDLKRLATSMLIAARDNGFKRREEHSIVRACVAKYRSAIRDFARAPALEVWYARAEVDALLTRYGDQFKPSVAKRTGKQLTKARTRDSMTAYGKLTTIVDGEPRIADRSPLIVPLDQVVDPEERVETLAALSGLVEQYQSSLPPERQPLISRFELVDFARKVVGVGSVGTRCWIALLLGRDHGEPLLLQVKEAQPSVLAEHVGASVFANEGQRVVIGQQLMQASSDIFLGWLRGSQVIEDTTIDYYVRQLKDWKGSAEIEQLRPDGLSAYGELCGWTLARAHARSGDRLAIASYLGSSDTFDTAILAFADAYADQNDRDYRALQKAVESGRITAVEG